MQELEKIIKLCTRKLVQRYKVKIGEMPFRTTWVPTEISKPNTAHHPYVQYLSWYPLEYELICLEDYPKYTSCTIHPHDAGIFDMM